MSRPVFVVLLALGCGVLVAQHDVNLDPVTEQHVMIPMRDGVRLSMYIYIPPGGDVKEIASEKGAEFFVISLPMIAEVEAEVNSGKRIARAA